ncbi:helix-turn-helix domain-containing protein [Arsukibacterium sp.]|uniref:helix-turn-helix domain-containing protein n=1 Tax=Arsukibacterium sp. TaxID=1977258 RepID=UPI002FDAB2FE
MLTMEQIRDKLKDRNLKEVSRRTGIGYANLHAIAKGVRQNPTYEVLKPLCDYLEENR